MSENGMVRPCSSPASTPSWRGGTEDKGARYVPEHNREIAVIGIDIGKFEFRSGPLCHCINVTVIGFWIGAVADNTGAR
jgi:hypothetical protein